MKRTLSLLLALIMVVGLLPNPPVFAANTGDDIYIDESASLNEYEESDTVDIDPFESDDFCEVEMPPLDKPDSFTEDIFEERPGATGEKPKVDFAEDSEISDGDMEQSDDVPEDLDSPDGDMAGPIDPAPDFEGCPELSPPEQLHDNLVLDHSNSRPSADSDGQHQGASGEGSGIIGGFADVDLIQSYDGVLLDGNLTWYANDNGDSVDSNGYEIDTRAQMPKFATPGTYTVTIKPDPTAASVQGATKLHINLFQLYVGEVGVSVTVQLDATEFAKYPNIQEVVIHVADTDETYAVDPIRVAYGSLTLSGLESCRLVLDGKSLKEDGKALVDSRDDQLLRIGDGNGAGEVKVSYVTFRNAPNSAVRALGGHIGSLEFSNCIFEDTCVNNAAVNNDGGAIDIWTYLPDSSPRKYTTVGSLMINACQFKGNQAKRFGGAVNLFASFDQVSIENSFFTNNKNLTTNASYYGGAIACLGFFNELKLSGNTFEGCESLNSNGGAVAVKATVGQLTISSAFKNCKANKGGAVYIESNTLSKNYYAQTAGLTQDPYYRINTLQISGSTFTNCSSSGGNGGGGVLLLAQIDRVVIGTADAPNTFTNCTVASGSAGGGIRFGSTELSAAPTWTAAQWAPAGMTIASYAGGTPYDAYFTRNEKNYTAYRSVTVTNTTFDSCQASYGGGFYIPNNTKVETLEITDVTVKNSVATSYTKEEDGKTTTSGGRGGGIALASFAPDCSIMLKNLQVHDNLSDSVGGGVYIDCMDNTSVTVIGGQYYSNTAVSGGGIYINAKDKNNVSISFSASKIFKNTTSSNGGGLYLDNSNGSSTFTDLEVYGNFAGAKRGASGSVVEKGTENCFGDGGGLYITGKNTATVTFVRGVIGARKVTSTNTQGETVVTWERSPNRAFAYTKEEVTPSASPDEPDVVSFTNGGGGRGGGIGVVGTSKGSTGQQDSLQLVMTDTKVCYNQSEYCGGGLYIGTCDAQLNNISVTDNQCGMVKNSVVIYEFREAFGLLGGGVAVSDRSTVAMNGGEITRNEARSGGGMIIDRGTTVTMEKVRVTYNEAHRWAGGIYVMGYIGELTNTLNATGCEFSYNVAGTGESGGNGGGVAVYTRASVNLTDTKFYKNEIRVGYVFTYNADGTKNYTLAEDVDNNPAYDEDGNPVYKEQYGYGAGLYCLGATAVLRGVDVNGNISKRRGGGVYGEYASNISVYHYPVEDGKTDYLNEVVTDQQGNRFIRSQIRNNTARDYAGGVGAVGNVEAGIASQLLLEGTLVDNNQVERHGGGGVYISSLSVCTITEGTVIQNNTAQRYGGGIYANIRGVIYVQGAEVINNTSHRNGGGLTISQDSDVIITGGRISGNKCDGGAGYGFGGGIYATGSNEYGASRITIQNGEISNNEASNNGGGVYAGGSSDTDPNVCTTVLIQGGTISGNRALGTSGSDYGYGGGILAGRASRVNVEGGSITGNNAVRYGGGLACNVQTIVNVDGGNILNNTAGNGGGIWLGDSARINVKNGMIKGNKAEAYWNDGATKVSGGNGGAILASASSKIFVTGGQITENYAIGTNYYSTGEEGSEHRQTSTGEYTQKKYQGGNGGGIYAQNNARVMVQQLAETETSGKITKNNASNNGGGIYVSGYYRAENDYGRAEVTVESGEISENIAGSYGGGIYTTGVNTKGAASCGMVTISGGIINKNKATENNGGGIAANVNSTVIVTGGSITENQAKNGGGVCAIYASTVTLNGGSVTKNQATSDGGGIYVSGHYTDEENYGRAEVTVQSGEISENIAGSSGGGIYTTGSRVKGAASCGLVTVSGGIISKNKATEDSGGGIAANVNSTVIVTGGSITENQAKNGGGVCAVYASTVTLNGGSVTQNQATSYGGGIYATGYYSSKTTYGRATVTVEGGTISQNIAGHSGGGIFTDGAAAKKEESSAVITISGGTISGNQATQNGGGVGADKYSAVLIKGGEITGNTCSDYGAGIYAAGNATVTMQQSDDGKTFGFVTYNTGAVQGGGIYAGNSAKVTLKKGNIQHNTATHGGGLFASGGQNTGSTVNVEGGEISHNTALLGNGGGLYVISGANVTISEGKINENIARHTDDEQNYVEDTGRGGGIYVTSYKENDVVYGAGRVTVTGGEIRKNTAQANGGAIYATSCDETNESYAASITVSGGSLYENTAQYGGAIYAVWCADVNIDDGAIYSNTADQGGGIYAGSNSDVSITGGRIYSNSAGSNGGGIYATGYTETSDHQPPSVTVSGGKLYSNTATENGGGIYSTHSAAVTVSNGEIYQNTAKNGGGICANTASEISITGGTIGGILEDGTTVANTATDKGGGIYATDSAKVTVSNGRIVANTALNGGGIYAGVNSDVRITGGQIYSNSASNNGGGIYAASTSATDEDIASSVTVSGGKLYDNTATEYGGGIYATFCADVAVSDGEIYRNTAKYGGGICANTNSDISITGGTIGGILEDGTTVGNTATVSGGGIHATGGAQVSMVPMEGDDTAIGSIIGNKAAKNGGGVYATNAAQVTLRKGDIKANSAQYGGGIYADGISGATQASQCATVLLDGGTVAENTATYGAGICVYHFSTVTVEDGLIDNNTATENGGGIYAINSATVIMRPKAGADENSGGVIRNNDAHHGAGMYLSEKAKVTVSGGTMENNVAKAGGGIYAGSTSTVTVENGKIDHNTAVRDGSGTGVGGGIYATGSATVVMQPMEGSDKTSGGVISNNEAYFGGGVYIANAATVTISAGEIVYNTSSSNGGGVYMTTNQGTVSRLTVTGGKISYNTSDTNAGGIYVTGYSSDTHKEQDGGIVTITNGEINHNEAKKGNGGGVFLTQKAQLNVSGGEISGNTATKVNDSTGFGGGIYASNRSSVTIDGGNITQNTAGARGGGIHGINQTDITVKGGDISDNKARISGGGVSLTNSASITVQGGKISDNTANQDGGGIYIITASTATVEGGEISGNTATRNGGGIYVGSTSGAAKVFIRKGTNEQGQVTVGTVRDNLADNGGGVFVLRGGTLTVNEGHIINNTAAAPKIPDPLETGWKLKSTELHGAGGGICVVGENLEDDQGNQIIATFKLEGTLVNDKLNMAIYGNESTFSGDEVFSNGNYTSLDIPLVSQMNLDGYELDIVGWYEDYNTGDTEYASGLNRKGLTSSAADLEKVKRYRNSTATERQIIADEYVDGSGLAEGIPYVNLDNAYVAMALGIPNASDDTVVVDYGTSVDINLLSNDMLLKSSSPETQSRLGLTLPKGDYGVNDKQEILYSKMYDKAGNKIELLDFKRYLTDVQASKESILNCGTAIWKIDDTTKEETGVLTYTMNTMELDAPETFYYVVPGEKFYYYGAVNVIPATSIYFEDNCGMVTYHASSKNEVLAKWQSVTNEGSTAAGPQAQDRPGASSILAGLDANNIYGYDGSYASTVDYSNGSAYKVTVSQHKASDENNFNNYCDVFDKSKGDYCRQKVTHTYQNDGTGKCSICLNTQDKHGINTSHKCTDGDNDNEYCDICSRWIGMHTTNARATFTFTGTGFDIVSLCSKNTGIVMASVYKGVVQDWDNPDWNNYVASYVVDTYYGYAYNAQTGEWEQTDHSGTTLYQVPVLQADLTKVERCEWDSSLGENGDYRFWYEDVGYGTYSVELYVAPSFTPNEHGYWSADFYLDAIRIYNPAGYNGGDNEVVFDAYKADGEAWPVYAELRDIFLTQKDLGVAEATGVIFIDGKGTPTIDEYRNIGPNNEVYLNGGQSVAFKLNASNYAASAGANGTLDEDLVKSVHVGIRGLTGSGKVKITGGTLDQTYTIGTTDLYYDISGGINQVVTITNAGETPISISNMKITHTTNPAPEGTGSGSVNGGGTTGETSRALSLFTMSREDADIALGILKVEELVDPVVTPKYPALSYNGMICYNVFFSAEDLGDLTADDLGLAVFDSYDPEGTVETAKDVIMGATEIDGLYMVATNGVHAKYLSDTQYFRAFAKKADGSFVYSKMVSYSALDYATNVLAKSDDVKLKQLVVAMLNYGAEAQKFFGYKTDDLMNKDLTADEQALLTGFDANSLNGVQKADPAKVGAFASTGGFASRYPAISFKGAFEINYFFTPANAVDGDMTLYFWNEDTYNSVTELTAENADKAVAMTLENGTYTASSDEIIARQLDKTLYVAAVYESDGVTCCSGVLPYSIAAYCQKPPADVQALATAAAIYGCTAKQFFV